VLQIINSINWTTVISSAVVATIIGSFQVVANRYVVRGLEAFERFIKSNTKKPEV
jgi:hypothetical protein